MARGRQGSLGSWAYGGAPAQGSTPHPNQPDSKVASNFLDGVCSATEDPISQYEVPALSGSTVRSDVCPGVWGSCAKKP